MFAMINNNNKWAVAIFLLLLDSVSCDNILTKIRTITTDIQHKLQQQHRKLAQPSLINYVPATQVSNYAAIDRDQVEIQSEFGKMLLGSESSVDIFANARAVYQKGANAKSYAFIGLTSDLLADYPAGTYVQGNSSDGGPVGGTLMLDATRDDNNVLVTYDPSHLNNPANVCRVGGSPNPNLHGCFASTGDIWIGPEKYGYNYDPNIGNMNDLTIQQLSTKAEATMYLCDHCPYEDYAKFYNYYGKYDYADEFIKVAFEQGRTELDRGNADFTSFSKIGLPEFISEATLILNIWMYVIREMEKAIDTCTDHKCSSFAEGVCRDTDSPYDISNWDQAVALYVGIEQRVGTMDQRPQSTGGFLLYNLANEYCTRFGTCGERGGSIYGAAQVNHDIFKLFESGKRYLLSGNCFEARRMKEAIVKLMTVPLIQGTLYNAFEAEDTPNSEAFRAMAAVNAASVLPIVYACNEDDALTIYNHLRATRAGGSRRFFADVKQALENNYECIGVTCSMVGGVLERNGDGFVQFAEPCGDYKLPSTTPAGGIGNSGGSSNSNSGSTTTGSTTTGSTGGNSNSGSTRPSNTGPSNNRPFRFNTHRTHRGANMNLIASVSAGVLVLLSACCVLCLCRTWKPQPVVGDGEEENYGIEIRETRVMNGGSHNGTSNDNNHDSSSFTIT